MNTKKLRQKIIDLAIRGKLVPQDPADEPAGILLEQVRAEKERLIKEGKIKRSKRKKAVSANVDKSRHRQLPEGWVNCTIDEIAFVTKLAGFEYTKDILPNLSIKGIPLFKGQNVQNGNIVYKFESYIPESISDSLPRSQINRKCILTPYVGTIGNVGIHSGEGLYHLGSNVGKIELYGSISEEYIAIYIRSGAGYAELTKTRKATAQNSISIQAIRDVSIFLPPLAEQKRIVEAVSNFNTLIDIVENNKSDILTNVAAAKQKILSLAISGKLVPQHPDDEPASVLLERIRSKREQLIKQGKIKVSKSKKAAPISIYNPCYENLPAGWAVCRLDEVLDYEQPTQYIVESTNYSDGYTTPVLTAGKSFIIGYTNEQNGICDDLPVIIFDDFTTDSRYVDFPFKVKSSAMKILRARQSSVKYLHYFMQTVEYSHSTHKRYWISDYSQTILALPPSAEQRRIVVSIENAFTILNKISETLD